MLLKFADLLLGMECRNYGRTRRQIQGNDTWTSARRQKQMHGRLIRIDNVQRAPSGFAPGGAR